jgi:hypothetical protein
MKINLAVSSLLFTSFLTACGGGGGGNPAVSVAVPLKSAYSALIAAGETKTFKISGDCAGTAVLNRSPAIAGVTFDGVSGRQSAVLTSAANLVGCTPATISSTSTEYYDSSFTQVGTVFGNGNFGVFLTPMTIPATATVGASGPIGTQTLYTNNSKTVLAGQAVTTYTVEADSATTAIVNLTIKSFDAANTLLQTEQDRYRVDATSGKGTLISVDVQVATGSKLHLLFQ